MRHPFIYLMDAASGRPKPPAQKGKAGKFQRAANRWADAYAHKRAPAGTEQVTVPNPGNKLIMHIGRPDHIEVFGRGEFTHARCTFTLPTDWRKVEPPEPSDDGGLIVARRINSPQVLRVAPHAAAGVGMSEVLY